MGQAGTTGSSIRQQNAWSGEEDIRADYLDGGRPLFWLALGMGCLTVLSLGFYRFWMSTRLRRHYWSRIAVLGDPFEYTGTGLEKLLGFLVAVIILAVYLTCINLGLAFLGLARFDDPLQLQIVLNLSLIASLPLIYFATYRARRYMAARTRWRGIRFGMEPAAWAYTWRAMLLTALSIISAGFLYPYQHFRLEKFKWDRTRFGTLPFRQNGSWLGLIGAWIWLYIVLVTIAGIILYISMDPDDPTAMLLLGLVMAFGYISVTLVAVRYRIAAFRYLWTNRTLGGAEFANDIDTAPVIGIFMGGTLLVVAGALAAGLAITIVCGLAFVAVAGQASTQALAEALSGPQAMTAAWPLLMMAGAGYIVAVTVGFALSHVCLVRPILRRQVASMSIVNAGALGSAMQRAHDDAAEAGGFAQALGVDVGAGI